ncbi:MAG: 1-deoxy-D-xylulose-5-phosphate reductoisomerase [Calditrichia bacterium]
MKKKIFLYGSTGSIGLSTLEVYRQHRSQLEIVGIAANKNWRRLLDQADELNPSVILIGNSEAAHQFRNHYSGNARVITGMNDFGRIIEDTGVDLLVNAVVGARGLVPTYQALQQGKPVAIANKETLVAAGKLMMAISQEKSGHLFPIDSEHSAIWQVLQGEDTQQVRRIILTASGGPFREKSIEEMKNVTVEQALTHPNWEMGPKITIDSATMMNKGLEIIEAYWLYSVPSDQIKVVVHKESIIHSMVEFEDGSVKAQLSYPDMKIPIAYALFYPDHVELNSKFLNIDEVFSLHFEPPDFDRFPALRLAYQALETSATHPCVLNAANEIAVEYFLNGKIKFTDIAVVVEKMLEKHPGESEYTLEQILELDRLTRENTKELLENWRRDNK